jgi:hypothetical protein
MSVQSELEAQGEWSSVVISTYLFYSVVEPEPEP